MKKKFGPTEFEAEIAKLKATGRMPSLEAVLAAVAESREKYAQQIRHARRGGLFVVRRNAS